MKNAVRVKVEFPMTDSIWFIMNWEKFVLEEICEI